jgi:formamidopyrimidine-DNA glycosylase
VPELPEVETVRLGLERRMTGQTIERVDVVHPRAVRRYPQGVEHFEHTLAGREVTGVRRRGKYLWLSLDGGDAIVCHLGMSGQLLLRPTGAPDERHLRARLALAGDQPQLRFVDQRMFGGLNYSPGGAVLPGDVAHIARDPLDPLFDDEEFVRRLRGRRTEVKRALLDQTLISGVGNIYADEALWLAELHGTQSTRLLSVTTVYTLLAAVREVFDAAITAGGTSFDSLYVNVNGESGYFSTSLRVYGCLGKPCARCETLVCRERFMNRSSFFCPRCQRR